MATTELATVTNNNNGLALGDRSQIKDIADRIRKMMPNATAFSEGEALAVAQVAAMNGLDPFNGEVWGIKGSPKDGKPGEWKGVMVGVKGLRKAGRQQAASEGGTYWTEFKQPEPNKYATKPGMKVWECILRDTVTVQAWGKSVNILTTAGVPYAEAIKMLGPCPQVVGVGIADPSQFSKMSLDQLSKKRAEADALKQRYQVSFSRPGAGAVLTEGDPMDDETAQAVEQSADAIEEGSVTEVIEEAEPIDERQQAYQQAIQMITPMGRKLADFNDSQLEALSSNKQASEEIKAAARLIIDYRIEAAQKEAQILQELGI